MNGIEDRVTSLLTWGLPLGALAFCAIEKLGAQAGETV